MVKKQNVQGRVIIAQLAERLGVDLKDINLAIATEKSEATARFHDGSLEVRLTPLSRPTIRIESPRSPGIYVELVDHQRDVTAPKEAIYHIKSYMPNPTGRDGGVELNGEVYSVYVGKQGILLDADAKRRVSELLGNK